MEGRKAMVRKSRWLWVSVLLTLVAAMTSACGKSSGGSSGSDSSGGKTVLTFWSRDSQKEFIQPVIDKYNSSQSKIQIKLTIIPSAEFVQKLGTAAATSTGPDVTSLDLVYAPYFAQAGALHDVTGKAKSLAYFDKLSPVHLRLGTYKGKIYALPFTAEASVLYYNKDLFKKAGLDPSKPPVTWADVETAAQKINALGGGVKGFYFSGACGGCNVFTLSPLIWASGGDIMKGDKAALDSPQVGEALALYRRMWDKGLISPSAKTDDGASFGGGFGDGKLGMVGSGAFTVGNLKKDHPTLDFGVTPLPGKDGGGSSFAGGDTIAVMKGTKKADAAWQFVQWATDTAQQEVAAAGVVPVRSDIATAAYVPQDPRYGVLADMMAKGNCPYSVVENALFNDSNGPWSQLIQKAVFGGGDIKAAQAQYQKTADEIVAKGANG
jgi:multiple sugar transport system substrate-binding protein